MCVFVHWILLLARTLTFALALVRGSCVCTVCISDWNAISTEQIADTERFRAQRQKSNKRANTKEIIEFAVLMIKNQYETHRNDTMVVPHRDF